ncbi:hypothetical protein SAMN05216428_10475 [Nitrosospira sp. Nsp11]|nr:hypothetical protein SAMN05216428_10475 [Nitrosospira sp. Nsp11]
MLRGNGFLYQIKLKPDVGGKNACRRKYPAHSLLINKNGQVRFSTIQSIVFIMHIYFSIRIMVKWLSFFMSFFRRSEIKNGTAKYGRY